MRIALIGAGNVGGTLGTVWAAHGHDVVFGARDDAYGHGRDIAFKLLRTYPQARRGTR